jgi:hypothetical protein
MKRPESFAGQLARCRLADEAFRFAPRLGRIWGRRTIMAKRPMTNIEKVHHLMTYSSYGALAQLFAMDALHKWADIVAKASPDQVGNGFVNGEAWIGVAREIRGALQTDPTIDDPELEEDETPFGEMHTEADSDEGLPPAITSAAGE